MAKYIVKQSGPLKGEVTISGAKNAVLPLMAATLLNEEECVIRSVPHLRGHEGDTGGSRIKDRGDGAR